MGFLDDLIAKSKGALDDAPRRGTSEDAVRHDLYDANMYREVVSEAPALAEMVDDIGYKYDFANDMVRDVMMEFWQSDPHLRQREEMDPRRLHNHVVATDIDSSPDTKEMRGFTRHDRYGAAMATISVTEKIKETLENLPDELEQQAEEAAQKQQQQQQAAERLAEAIKAAMDLMGMPSGPGDQGEPGAPGDGEAEGPGESNEQGEGGGAGSGVYVGEGPLTEAQAQAAQALNEALGGFQEADEAMQEAMALANELAAQRGYQLIAPIEEGIREATDALAAEEDLFSHWGVEPGVIKKMDFEERRKLVDALKNNRISEFMDLIGRFRMLINAEHMRAVEFGRDEAYDTELSDRLPDVLGSEIAKLANRHLRLDFLNRLVDRTLLSKKYRGWERVGKGALIYVGDTSGSMDQTDSGGITREAWMKALMLAMLLQAKLQRRDFVVILFSSVGQQKMWTFPKGQCSPWEMIEVVEFSFGGGTDFMKPLDMATDVLEKDYNREGTARADIIFATDDDAKVTPEWLLRFNERRDRLDFRVFGIAIGKRVGTALKAVSTPGQTRSITEFANPGDMTDLVRML